LITCFNQPYASICWNENLKIVELTWKGFVTSEEYRQTQDQALVIISEKKATLMLMDARDIKVIMPEDQAWAVEVWAPKLALTGAKKFATVTPQSAVARMNASSMERGSAAFQAAAPYEYRSFGTTAEAQNWLAN